MSGFIGPTVLAPVGSTGNNTHVSAGISPVYALIAVVFVVEAIGATPTVTWKAQGSLDPGSLADGSSAWFDLPYVLDSTDTLSQATRVATTVSSQVEWLALSNIRFFRKVRIVTSANTNVTYRAELQQQYRS